MLQKVGQVMGKITKECEIPCFAVKISADQHPIRENTTFFFLVKLYKRVFQQAAVFIGSKAQQLVVF